jgi:P4 family phage/plasmid primase-like protien
MNKVYITEGLFDSLVLSQYNKSNLSLVTIKPKRGHVDLIAKALGSPQKLDVYISMDTDPTDAGQEASLMLAKELRRLGYRVSLILLPLDFKRKEARQRYFVSKSKEDKELAKIDLPEYILENGIEAFNKLEKDAPTIEDVLLSNIKTAEDSSFWSIVDEIAELNVRTKDREISQIAQKIKNIDKNSIQISDVRKAFKDAKSKDCKKRKKQKEIEESIDEAIQKVTHELISKLKYDPTAQEMWMYRGKSYESIPTELAQREIEDFISNNIIAYGNLRIRERNSAIREAHNYLKRRTSDSESFFRGELRYIAFQNGVFDLIKRKLVTFSEKLPVFNLLGYHYDKDAKCPLWENTVEEILVDRDKIEYFQMFCGYCLANHFKYHKSVIFVGDGSNGKSTLLELVIDVLGEANVSCVKLDEFNDKFMLIKLKGKLANIAAEACEDSALSTQIFKEASAGGFLSAGEKNKPNVSFRNRAKIMQSMNDFPLFKKKNFGLYRRLDFLACEKDFSKSRSLDFELPLKLKNELSGVFNWMLEGLSMLEENKGFITPVSSKKMLNTFAAQTCSAESFISEEFCESFHEPGLFLINQPGSTVSKALIYSEYRDFCHTNGFRPMNNVSFWKVFRRTFKDVGEGQSRSEGRYIRDIKYLRNQSNGLI